MGSSSSSRSGCWSSSLHSATRRRSPPERLSTSDVRRRAAQRVHRLVEAAVEVPRVGVVEVGLQVAHLGEQLVVVGVGVAHLLGDLVVAVELALDLADGLLDVLQDGLALGQRRLLLEHADGRAGVEDRVAVVGVVEPGHDLEQRRLAGAVGSDDADLGAVQEREGDVVEDDLVAVGLAHVAQGEDVLSHGPSLRGAPRRLTIGPVALGDARPPGPDCSAAPASSSCGAAMGRSRRLVGAPPRRWTG